MGGLFGGPQQQSASPVTSLRLQTSTRGRPIPIAFGRPRVSANLIWYGDLVATAHQESQGGKGGGQGGATNYTYTASIMLGLCEGEINFIPRVWRQKEIFTAQTDACAQMGLTYESGDYVQQPLGWLTTKHADQALSYRGLAYVAGTVYGLGGNADLLNHSFEVDTTTGYSQLIRDANIADVIKEVLTNPHYGSGFPLATLADQTLFSNYCIANNIFVSPVYQEQRPAREILASLLKIANSAPVLSQGKLRFMPFGDAEVTANGVTYFPNLTPAYDLTDDDFRGDNSEDPIRMTRKSIADAYNCVRVKFYNRAIGYNEDIAEAKDDASIELYGMRAMDVLEFKEICDATTARNVAQIILQRALYILNEYEFKLGWNKILLDPMDLVTLTDVGLGMNKVPVRILDIVEDDEGLLIVKAEDFPLNVCNAAKYDTQPSDGYSSNFNSPAGTVSANVVFEVPVELCTSNDDLEVWIAAGGGSNYGGCEVWMSIDNATFKQVGSITGQSRLGSLTAAIPASANAGMNANTASVVLSNGGQLLSGTEDDALLFNTLCYVGGELVAYETATLTSAAHYDLTRLNRGVYRSGTKSHAVGEPFVRIDDAIAKVVLTSSYVGRQIFIKLLAFNQFGGGRQLLADVNAVSYVVTGRFLNLPPFNVSFLKVTVKAGGTREFTFNSDISTRELVKGGGYRIKYRLSGSGLTWAECTPLHDGLIQSSPYETVNPKSGLYDFGIVEVDSRGNESMSPLFSNNVVIGDIDFIDAKHVTSVTAGNMDYFITQINATIAANKAESAQNSANAANAELANVASDNVLAMGEKSAVILDYNAIIDERAGIVASASNYSVSSTAYTNAITALTTYLTGLTPAYIDLATNTPIVGATFRQKFADVYSTRQAIENAIAAQAKALAGAAQTAANAAANAAAAAQSSADQANIELANVASDNVLAMGEKSAVLLNFTTITNEQAGIDAQADLYSVSRSAYDSAVSALSTYIYNLSPSINSLTANTPIVGATFRQKFADVYTTRQTVLNAVAAASKVLVDAANNEIANISSDNVLSKGEKSAIVLDYQAILNEQSGIDAQADAFTQSRTTYDNAVTSLTSYLTNLSPSYSDLSTNTPISGATFRQKFADVYSSRQGLLNSIAAKAKALADAAQGAATAANTAASTAQTAANTANNELANIASDNVLSSGEKPAVVIDYNNIINEKPGIDAQADAFAQSKTAYGAAVTALTSYLTGLTPAYNAFGVNTPIIGTTFRQKFNDVYLARQSLLNAIATQAGSGANIAPAAIKSLMIAPNQVSSYGSGYSLLQQEVPAGTVWQPIAAFSMTLTGRQQTMVWASLIVAGAHIGTSANYDNFYDGKYWKFNAADTTVDFQFMLFGAVSGIYVCEATLGVGVPRGDSRTVSIQGVFPAVPAQLYSVHLSARAKSGGEAVGARQISQVCLEMKA